MSEIAAASPEGPAHPAWAWGSLGFSRADELSAVLADPGAHPWGPLSWQGEEVAGEASIRAWMLDRCWTLLEILGDPGVSGDGRFMWMKGLAGAGAHPPSTWDIEQLWQAIQEWGAERERQGFSELSEAAVAGDNGSKGRL